MLELTNNNLAFAFPNVHEHARMSINFQRTLRIPDDGKEYPLPPGLGSFPIKHTDDYKSRVPEKWLKRGGVMTPLYQSEALWIAFSGQHVPGHGQAYPFAVKIAAGKRSAVTGRPWSQSLREKDYCIIPQQPWLDGFVVEEGTIRQFVAMPLGMGMTAEAQLSGKEEFGGIQVEVIPMKKEHFLRRFPKLPPPPPRRGLTRGRLGGSTFNNIGFSDDDDGLEMMRSCVAGPAAARSIKSMNADMGLGAGGKMKQQVFEDPYGIDEWDTENTSRCFIHLANSLAWEAITGAKPPTTPFTSADYARRGLPWFEHYRDDLDALRATSKMAGLKSILELGFQKGLSGMIADNESIEVKSDKVVKVPARSPGQVRDGVWK
jgi:hypothetical protein